jgi:Fe-S cluster assembly protein SufD
MTASNDFLTRLLDRAAAASPQEAAVRAANISQLRAVGLPEAAGLEAFKYTPITAFYTDDLLASPAPTEQPLVRFAGETPAGVTIRRSVSTAVAIVDHPLALVNGSLLGQVIQIDVAPGCHIEAPLELDFVHVPGCVRVELNLGPGSSLRLIEYLRAAASATNRVLTITLGANASLTHQRLELQSAERPMFSLLRASVGEAANYLIDHYLIGAQPRRSDVVIDLRGRAAATELTSALVAGGNCAVDLHVTVNHFGADTRSRQLVHGIANDRGRLTFNGRIEIHSTADGSDAQLNNRNLLLAATARVNAKPELEIHTRNVACSHGATVGQLDAAQLFYLRSRGIAELPARRLLTRAFLARCVTPAARALDAESALQNALEL